MTQEAGPVRTDEEKELIRKAKEKALNLLSYSDRSEKTLRERLKEGDFPPFAVEEAIEYVQKYGYQSDSRFAENYIRSHQATKSRREMAEVLRQKGVSKELIEASLSSAELTEAESVARLFTKKYRGKDLSDPKVYSRAIAYFLGKGFSYEDVKAGIRQALEKSENTD